MSIILRNYHSRSSAVRGDEAIELLQRWEICSLFYNNRYPDTRIPRGHLECEPAAQNDDFRGNFRMAARIHVH